MIFTFLPKYFEASYLDFIRKWKFSIYLFVIGHRCFLRTLKKMIGKIKFPKICTTARYQNHFYFEYVKCLWYTLKLKLTRSFILVFECTAKWWWLKLVGNTPIPLHPFHTQWSLFLLFWPLKESFLWKASRRFSWAACTKIHVSCVLRIYTRI